MYKSAKSSFFTLGCQLIVNMKNWNTSRNSRKDTLFIKRKAINKILKQSQKTWQLLPPRNGNADRLEAEEAEFFFYNKLCRNMWFFKLHAWKTLIKIFKRRDIKSIFEGNTKSKRMTKLQCAWALGSTWKVFCVFFF